MRILVLGGTVFLSAATTRLAVSRGHEVTCLARGSSQQPPEGTRWIRGDRDDGAEAYASVSGQDWDAVIDVARQPIQVRQALGALADSTAHWTLVSTVSVYADETRPAADEAAELLPALEEQQFTDPEQYGNAKVACEQLVLQTIGDRAHLCRAGLIGGPGDRSDRFGYWPARFARRQDDEVLVPDTPRLRVQVIDVDDLAGWLLDAAESGVTGPLNAVGDPTPFQRVLDICAGVAGHRGDQVAVDPHFLVEHGVQYWAGPDSLPLWVPPEYRGFGTRSNAAAKSAGMLLRPLQNSTARALAYERKLGLDRERRAGLSPAKESEILQAWSATARS